MIGVFDSGFGGITVLRALLKNLPEYDFVYLGDNARAPYGNKSQELIYDYTVKAVDFLFQQGTELVILACNTASSKALRKIQQEYLIKKYPQKKVLGVIIPTVEELNKNIEEKVGIIGTRATIESGVYDKEIKKHNNKIKTVSLATPLLVPLIEEAWINKIETKKILKKYLRPLKKEKINKLILACTHYPLLLKQIKPIMGSRCEVVDTAQIVGEKTKKYLERHPEIQKKLSQNKKISFFTTDNPKRFKDIGSRFLGKKITECKQIKLD